MATTSPGKRDFVAIADVKARDVPVTIATVWVKELHDTALIETIGGQLYSLVEEHGRKNLIVNLGQVQTTLTYFLGKLIGLQKRTTLAKGKLALCSITPYVMEALEVCGLKKCFAIYADEQEALQKHF